MSHSEYFEQDSNSALITDAADGAGEAVASERDHLSFGGEALWHETDRGSWMQTASGGRFYPFDPRPEEVSLYDLIVGLPNICRYGGQVEHFFSVAQHSVMGSYLAEDDYDREVARQFLLHDAVEYLIGDQIRPLKYSDSRYLALEADIWRKAICPAFGMPEELHPGVKATDNVMIAWEKRDLLPNSEEWGGLVEVPEEDYPEIYPQGPEMARRHLIMRFAELFPELSKEIGRIGNELGRV